MSTLSKLASKNRQNIIIPLGVATASFLVAFVAGSLILIPSGSDAVESDVDISVDSVIEMSMSTSSLKLDLTPTSGGSTKSGDITATVSTNNATGYTLSLGAASADGVNLAHESTADKISNSANSSAGALAANTWGYNKNSGTTPTTFLRIPSPNAPDAILTTSAPELGSTATVTIAANANMSIPSGTYTSLLYVHGCW